MTDMNKELSGIYALWKRELIRFFRSKSRLIGSLAMPFFFLAILGSGLNNAFSFGAASATSAGGGGYLDFIAPGIIGMVLMFGSMFSGMIVIMDRQFGFLKETLVAPISRLSVVLGKAFGGATTAMIQGIIILFIAMLMGVQIQVLNIFLLLVFMFMISMMFVSLGIALASTMEDMHGFQLIMNFLIMPLFFLSGALFPLTSAPELLRSISMLDPLTYGVNGLRYLLTGSSEVSFLLSFAVILIFTLTFIGLAMYLFKRIEE